MKVYTIGRSADCTIIIDDPMVSRRHALLKVYPLGKMELVALGQNGTFVNKVQLKNNTPFPVSRKDVVKITQNQVLDWKQIPNPLKFIKIGVISFFVIIGIILLVCIGSYFNNKSNDGFEEYENNNIVEQSAQANEQEKSVIGEDDDSHDAVVDTMHKMVSFEDLATSTQKKETTSGKKSRTSKSDKKSTDQNKKNQSKKKPENNKEKEGSTPFLMF